MLILNTDIMYLFMLLLHILLASDRAMSVIDRIGGFATFVSSFSHVSAV